MRLMSVLGQQVARGLWIPLVVLLACSSARLFYIVTASASLGVFRFLLPKKKPRAITKRKAHLCFLSSEFSRPNKSPKYPTEVSFSVFDWPFTAGLLN